MRQQLVGGRFENQFQSFLDAVEKAAVGLWNMIRLSVAAEDRDGHILWQFTDLCPQQTSSQVKSQTKLRLLSMCQFPMLDRQTVNSCSYQSSRFAFRQRPAAKKVKIVLKNDLMNLSAKLSLQL